MQAGGRTDIDDGPILPILHTKVGRSSPHELKGCTGVQVLHRLPLLIRHLMYDPIPREPRIIDNDMNLAATEFRRTRHEPVDVFLAHHVARDGDRLAAGDGGSDFGCRLLSLFCYTLVPPPPPPALVCEFVMGG